jgi:hypothetical protein
LSLGAALETEPNVVISGYGLKNLVHRDFCLHIGLLWNQQGGGNHIDPALYLELDTRPRRMGADLTDALQLSESVMSAVAIFDVVEIYLSGPSMAS